jgi:hypothetical protein
MTEALLPIPEGCSATLEALLLDPLDPGLPAEAHLQTCLACAEARVAYLAQEDFPAVLAPAGYFERLPNRVQRKLPARPSLQHRIRPFTWAVAATLLLAVGAGAFWAGQANRTPLVEAALPHPAELSEPADVPFQDHEEEAAQLQTLSPEEMAALLKRLDTPTAPARPLPVPPRLP